MFRRRGRSVEMSLASAPPVGMRMDGDDSDTEMSRGMI